MAELKPDYTAELNPPKNIFNELSPAFINLCLALTSQSTPDLGQHFTYAELGAGYGLSIAAWAAQYPAGTFFSLNPRPGQVAWAQKLADNAGLDNLKIKERSYRQLMDEELPQMDYIVIHGGYSLAGAEERADIRAFAAKFLKPGGALYLGYSAQPGWSLIEPMRRLLLEGTAATGEANPQVALGRGLNFLKELEEAGALYFKAAAGAGPILETWRKSDLGFLAGDIMNPAHRAFYFSELLAELADTKTAYVGSLDLTNYLEAVITPQDFLTRLSQVSGSLPMRETAKDLLYNTASRRDLFVKGPQALERSKAENALKKMRLVLAGTKGALPEKVILKGVEVSLKAEIYQPVIDLLETGPVSLEEIMAKTSLTLPLAAQAATVLMALNLAMPVAPGEVPAERIKRFNTALDGLLGSETFNAILAVNGAWQPCGLFERLYFLSLIQGREPEDFIKETLSERKWIMRQEGQEVADPAKVSELITEQVKNVAENLPAILKRLGLE